VPRQGLTSAKVVAAAAELADRDGLHAMSLAALADTLGVRVPSLYKHVDGLDDLQRRLAAEGISGLLAALQRAVQGKHGREALLAVGAAYRRYAKTHPGQYQVMQRAAQPDEAHAADAEQIVAALTGVMGDYGLHGVDAVHAVRALRSALHGFVELERVGGFGLPASLNASFAAMLATFDRGLRAT